MAEKTRVGRKSKASNHPEIKENYEVMIVFKPLIPEDMRNKLINSIAEQVAAFEGEFVLKDNWGKRHLAYKINGHEEGYYVIYKLIAPTSAISKLNNEFKLMPDVLRFVIIKESEL